MAINNILNGILLLSKEWPLLLKTEARGKILVLTLRYEKNRRIQKKLVKCYSDNQQNKLTPLQLYGGREKDWEEGGEWIQIKILY